MLVIGVPWSSIDLFAIRRTTDDYSCLLQGCSFDSREVDSHRWDSRYVLLCFLVLLPWSDFEEIEVHEEVEAVKRKP